MTQNNLLITRKSYSNYQPIIKKMLKKIYITILAFMFTAAGVYAQDPEVKIHDVTSGPGEITVPVEMVNFTDNVNSFTFKITADEAILDFDSLANVEGFSAGSIEANQNGSTLVLTWYDVSGYQPDGHVFDIVLEYTGEANTIMAFQEGENEVTYGTTEVENITYTDGVITTTEPLPDPVVNIQDVTAAPGEISVPVEMHDFQENINSIEYHIQFNNDILQFVTVENVVDGFAGELNINQSGNEIAITWQDTEGFLPIGQVFDLVFDYSGGFDSELIWGSGNEVTSEGTAVANLGFVNGSVTQADPVDGTVSLESQTVASGEEVMMPVNFSGDGFSDVSAFTLKIDHDQNSLNFQGIESGMSEDLVVNQNGSEISIQYQGSAQDFTDANVLDLTFIYSGVSTTRVEFMPGSEVNNEIAEPLAVNYVDGNVNPAAADDTITISEVEAFAGQSVTIPVMATEVGDVGAVDFYIEFDNNKLSFADWNAEQLEGWEFNQNGGEITLGWFGTGNITEGTLLNLEFVYEGGGDAGIVFTSGTEVTSQEGTAIPMSFKNGGIVQATSDSKATIAEVTSCDQNTATVPVTLSDVDPISAFDLEIGFNADGLDFIELDNVNPDIADYNINTNEGEILINWSTSGGGIDANGKLFDIVFDYKGAYSEITFNSGSEFINELGQTLPVQFVDGEVDCNYDERTLTISKEGEGEVVVSKEGTEMVPDEGTDNQYTVLWGTDLTIEATGAEGWSFDSWEGSVDDNDANPTTITMDNDYGVITHFTRNDYTITLAADPEEGGTVTGGGTSTYGSEVTIEATPNEEEGWFFISWTDSDGNVVSEDASYTFTMPFNDITYTANFDFNTGIEDGLDNSDISVYPNPADNRLSVKIANNAQEIENIIIYNAVGSQVMTIEKSAISEKLQINVSDLKSGVFYMQLRSESGMVSKKFVKL